VIKHLLIQDLNGDAAQFNALPAEAGAWLMFRRLVDVVLNCDLAAYFLLCAQVHRCAGRAARHVHLRSVWRSASFSRSLLSGASTTPTLSLARFAWYWGDFFFLCDQDLNFSRGVYAIFPHPMYTVGYFFMYGFALLSSSYTVLVVSLVAHAMQLVFLKYVEDPHIEKTYDVANAKKVAAKERLGDQWCRVEHCASSPAPHRGAGEAARQRSAQETEAAPK
jgi:phosphatidylethanolamine N-methyltransferase